MDSRRGMARVCQGGAGGRWNFGHGVCGPRGDGKLLSRIWVLCSRGWAESVREVQGVDVILDMEFVAPGGG